ncbi:MAG: hypothetical protein PHD45_05685 [Bacteroidales bacterium]|nr:hypothetical protein [Bacteroidales bacterium]
MEKFKHNIWITLLLAIILIGIFGYILPKNPDKYLKDRFWSFKVHNSRKYNFIILGDSRTYRGISPYEIENILPEFSVFNFAFSNGGLNPMIYKATDAKLNEMGEPKIILLGVSALTINDLSLPNEQYIQELTRAKEEIFERIYFGEYLNYFSPVTPIMIKDLIKGEKMKSNYISIYHDNGWVESEKFPQDTMEAMPYYEKDFTIHSTNYQLVNQLCEQIRTWESKGIKVFAFRPPASIPLVALEDSTGNYNEHLIKQKIELSGGHWIDIDPTSYNTYDGSHLSKGEARKLSKYIANEVKIFLNNKP